MTTRTLIRGTRVTAGTTPGCRERTGLIQSKASDPEARKRSRAEGVRVVRVAWDQHGGADWMYASDLRLRNSLERLID
ncbi:MAG: hypothetical protein UY96_C0003G0056 [Parcubacteria group bacterium GW2011_GWB1_56_8]|nr:MAG: hypothetical protein UY96_C0003G0056 [Parcubacteria group bacterium GW2011_GWB1_56_8]